jgi:hypothetical protein
MDFFFRTIGGMDLRDAGCEVRGAALEGSRVEWEAADAYAHAWVGACWECWVRGRHAGGAGFDAGVRGVQGVHLGVLGTPNGPARWVLAGVPAGRLAGVLLECRLECSLESWACSMDVLSASTAAVGWACWDCWWSSGPAGQLIGGVLGVLAGRAGWSC